MAPVKERGMTSPSVGQRSIPDPQFPGVHGEVVLEGGYVARHGEELLRRVDNVVADSAAEYPAWRVLGVSLEAERVTVSTNSQALALRVARELVATFHGAVARHWSDGNEVVRLVWRREWNRR
jgi:hypothetical protein